MIDWDRYRKFWNRYWKRSDRARKQDEERSQLLTQAVMEIVQDFGPLTPMGIADYLGQRGWRYQSAKTVRYVLLHDLVGHARQDAKGLWSLAREE